MKPSDRPMRRNLPETTRAPKTTSAPEATMATMATELASPVRRRTLGAGLSIAALGAKSFPAAAAAEPVTITVAAFPAVDQILKAALPAFAKKYPGVRVQVVSREFSDHHTAMTTAIATGTNLPDLMALEAGFMGRFAGSGAFESLSAPPYDAQRFRAQFVGYTFAQATAPTGELIAMPTDIGVGALFYRHDLLSRAGLKEADLTRSWESYVQAGSTIKAATGAYLVSHARDIKDIVIRSNLGAGQGIYFDQAGALLVESPRFRRAFELARTVRQQQLDAKTQAWSSEWSESFKRGTVATQMMGSWFAGHLANWLAPQTKGLWRTAGLPDGALASWGGTFYAIPRRASHKPQAWDLVRLMTLERERQIDAFKTQDAFPALLEAHADAYFKQPVAFLGDQVARVLWRELAARTPATPLNRMDPIAEEVVNNELDKVLAGKKEIASALADAAALLLRRVRR